MNEYLLNLLVSFAHFFNTPRVLKLGKLKYLSNVICANGETCNKFPIYRPTI